MSTEAHATSRAKLLAQLMYSHVVDDYAKEEFFVRAQHCLQHWYAVVGP